MWVVVCYQVYPISTLSHNAPVSIVSFWMAARALILVSDWLSAGTLSLKQAQITRDGHHCMCTCIHKCVWIQHWQVYLSYNSCSEAEWWVQTLVIVLGRTPDGRARKRYLRHQKKLRVGSYSETVWSQSLCIWMNAWPEIDNHSQIIPQRSS